MHLHGIGPRKMSGCVIHFIISVMLYRRYSKIVVMVHCLFLNGRQHDGGHCCLKMATNAGLLLHHGAIFQEKKMYLFLEHAGGTGLAQTARAAKYLQCACAPGKDASIAGTTKKKKKKKKKNILRIQKKKTRSHQLLCEKKTLLFKFSSQVFGAADSFFSFLSSFILWPLKKPHFKKKEKKKENKLCGRLTALFFVLAGQRTSVNGAQGASTAAG